MRPCLSRQNLRIWIDLANSPHVLVFEPIARRLREKGHELFFTLRDFAQTIPLARARALEGPVVGGHGGKSRVKKVVNISARTAALVRFAKKQGIDFALGHNSYAQVVAAKVARVPVLTMMDYEGQPANHLAFRLADWVLVPKFFPEEALRKFGAKRIHTYTGFKEELYLADFVPQEDFVEELASISARPIDQKRVLVTVRSPATMALYHRFQNPLFSRLLERLRADGNAFVVLLARTEEQRKSISQDFPEFFCPQVALDGPNLLYHSDLVISAGGTMNREAALLGTPAYTLFAGELPAVDEELVRRGWLGVLRSEADIDALSLQRKDHGPERAQSQVLDEVAGVVEEKMASIK